MHLLLTDRLVCPRCGPPFGLILLAREIRDRRVLQGDLGCAHCHERFPVRGGFVDLRVPPRDELTPPDGDQPPVRPERSEAVRLGALMGVTQGPGALLLKGPCALHAGLLAEIIGQVEVVAVGPVQAGQPESEGVSRLVAGPGMPFYEGSFRGLVLSGPITDVDVSEAVRVVAPRGRVVILDSPPGARDRLKELGTRLLVEED
jgi:uncharacterized protein YbaR (Trm112 family)